MSDSRCYEYDSRLRLSRVNITDFDLTKYDWRQQLGDGGGRLRGLAEKRMKFTTKLIQHDSPHLRHVAILPWEIKNENVLQIFSRYRRKCKQIAFSIASNLFIHKFWYFGAAGNSRVYCTHPPNSPDLNPVDYQVSGVSCRNEFTRLQFVTQLTSRSDWNLQDWKMTDEVAGVEFAGLKNDGLKMTE